MQLLFYAVTAIAIAIGMRLWGGAAQPPRQRARGLTSAGL
jgi:hypothetical protein